jgi:uncharacterized protein
MVHQVMGMSSGQGQYTRSLRRRRIVAMVVVLAMVGMMVAGAVAGLLAVVRGDASAETAQAETTVAASPSITEAPPTTQVQAAWSPSLGDPARVLIVGDSDAGAFGPSLLRLLESTGVVTTTLDYKVSSGLSRPDFFDWPARLREQLADVDPHVVVATFGGNDAQDLTVDGRSVPVADPAWSQEYRTRVREVLDVMLADDRHVVWVGIPNASSASFTQRLVVQRDAVVAELGQHPMGDRIRYVDTWSRFAGRSGGYADYIVDPRDGVGKKVRAADGFHLNMAGAEILAGDIFGAMTTVLSLPDRDPVR